MSDPQRLPIPVMNFTGEMFAKAAEGAYQAMCAQLNLLMLAHPEDEARLILLHDQALQVRDMIAHQGQLVQKVYELAHATQEVADKSRMAFAVLEDAIVSQDSNNPYVGRLIAEIQEVVYTQYGADEDFTDQVHEKIAQRMAYNMKGVNTATAAKFLDIIGSDDKLLPEHIEEAFAELLQTWADEGGEVEENGY